MTEPAHSPEPAHAPAATSAQAGAAPPQPLFSPDDWQRFHAIDRTAAAYIAGLMAGIFTVGLILYLIVLWSVAV
jgi:hypothetical protein